MSTTYPTEYTTQNLRARPCVQCGAIREDSKPIPYVRPEPKPLAWYWHLIGCIVMPVYLPVLLLSFLGRALSEPGLQSD
jgi:hypothetical protein